ncbi:MAG TPA: hypothetical protein VJ343_00235, partial [archaeon]|nr:hypothetical protein [archaeon]
QNQVREELSRTLSTLLSLEKIFSDSSPSQTDVFQTLAKMHNIYSSFARLVPIVRLLPTLRPLQQEANLIIDRLQQIDKLQKEQLLLMTALLPAPSKMLELLKQKKLDSLRNPTVSAKIKPVEDQLLAQIAALSTSPHSQGLATAVQKIASATMQTEVLVAEKEYCQHYTALIKSNQSTISSLQIQNLSSCQKSIADIKSSKQTDIKLISDNISAVQRHQTQAEKELNELETWAREVKDISFWNINFFDMNGLIDILKNIAFDRVKEKVSGLVDSLYHPLHYNGILNHLFFIPFIQNYAKGI